MFEFLHHHHHHEVEGPRVYDGVDANGTVRHGFGELGLPEFVAGVFAAGWQALTVTDMGGQVVGKIDERPAHDGGRLGWAFVDHEREDLAVFQDPHPNGWATA